MKRDWSKWMVAWCLVFALNQGLTPALPVREPVDQVNLFTDTANSRWFFFGGACRPFGLIKLFPDMIEKGDWGAGYRYNEPVIRGFSHLHCWQLSGLPVMPMTGRMRGPEGPAAYGSRYSHQTETARPGYYAVTLEGSGIRVELTATTRVGFHRYTFPAGRDNFLVFDLGREWGPAKMSSFTVRQTGPTELTGEVTQAPTRRRPKPVPTFFVVQFNRPFAEFGGWGPEVKSDEVTGGNGRGGMFVRFETSDAPVLMKAAVSYCDAEGARKNLAAEAQGWDFETVKESARAEWNEMLGRVLVSGGTSDQTTRFYTDLWHALLGRSIWSDADGRYSDFTGETRRVRQIPLGPDGLPRYNAYNSDAFWGAQWGIGLLWSLAYPRTMSGFVNSMVDMYKDGGLIPRGPAGGNYTYVMTGASSTPFIVASYQKGIRDFDVETAYAGMVKNAGPGGMMAHAGYEHNTAIGGGIEYYLDRGYVPDPRTAVQLRTGAYHVSGAGQTLEYAYQDWALAQMASALGRSDDAARFSGRAGNYKNIFDPRLKMMRPRTVSGAWLRPFNPESRVGWVEANALQSTWYVPQDPAGLIELMGGPEEFSRRLDEAFKEAEPRGFIGGAAYRGAINYGNQPNMHVAWLFHYAGKPWLSEKWVRRVKETMYGATGPEAGYHGDEDQGLMGSLSALMAMGLFDVQGGCGPDPVWLITPPLFERVEISLDQVYYPGGKFIITVRNQSRENLHVQRAWLNGKELSRAYLFHREIVAGGELTLELGPEPNRGWGAFSDLPPSMTSGVPGSP